MLDHLHNLCDDDVIIRSISDAFRAKASQTLIKRAGSLERFARWSFDHGSPSPFRAGEQDLYEYLCFLRTAGAKPTSANHFLQAWRFLHGTIVLIYSQPSEVISTTCEGAARDQYLTKAPLKQKSPLTRAQVEELERRTVESADTKLVCVCWGRFSSAFTLRVGGPTVSVLLLSAARKLMGLSCWWWMP